MDTPTKPTWFFNFIIILILEMKFYYFQIQNRKKP